MKSSLMRSTSVLSTNTQKTDAKTTFNAVQDMLRGVFQTENQDFVSVSPRKEFDDENPDESGADFQVTQAHTDVVESEVNHLESIL